MTYVFDDVGLAGLKREPMLSCWSNLLFIFVSYYFHLFFLLCKGWLCGVGVFGLIDGRENQQDSFLIIIIIIIITDVSLYSEVI